VVLDILDNERRRLIKLLEKYESEVSMLPRGSLSLKRRGNRDYAYLAHREAKKVVFDYIGPAASDAVEELKRKIQRRRDLEDRIRQTKANLEEVERSLRGQR
jgi:hypothetical protein